MKRFDSRAVSTLALTATLLAAYCLLLGGAMLAGHRFLRCFLA